MSKNEIKKQQLTGFYSNIDLPDDIYGEEDDVQKEIDEMLLKLPQVDLRFLGSVPDVIPYLAVSDIALLASHEEGFSNSILDYMNASLPVVATRVGGNAEAIINGTSGYIVPPQNSKEISKRLKDLCLSIDLRVSMGSNGRKDLERYFSLERCLEEYTKLYSSLTKKSQSKNGFSLGDKNF